MTAQKTDAEIGGVEGGTEWVPRHDLDGLRRGPLRYDFDGNELQGVTEADRRVLLWTLFGLVAFWTGVVLLVRWMWTRGGA